MEEYIVENCFQDPASSHSEGGGCTAPHQCPSGQRRHSGTAWRKLEFSSDAKYDFLLQSDGSGSGKGPKFLLGPVELCNK